MIRERYGHHTIEIDYRDNDYAQVTINDLSNIRWPLVWSSGMTYKQANAALEIFKAVGYFDYYATV